MNRLGFDNEKYVKLQSQNIRDRISKFGGKLFDDFHASRVLPGFAPDSKVKMLLEMKDGGGDRHRHFRRRHRAQQAPG